MVIDTSAILAIVQREPERPVFLKAIESAQFLRMSVASLVEVSMVIEARRGHSAVIELDHFLTRAGIEFVPVDLQQARFAREAFSRFGKGRHRARLNLGDCFAYAAAKYYGEQLLCKGDDFRHTDIKIYPEPSLM